MIGSRSHGSRVRRARVLSRATACALLLSGAVQADPLVFRGRLDQHAAASHGEHAFRLTLFASPASTVPVAGPLELSNVAVAQGDFAVEADFGALPPGLQDGFLAIEVKGPGDAGYVALGMRTPVHLKGAAVCPAAWNLAGNAGTDPASNFLGTTDATALELRTRNARSLRIEPSAELYLGTFPITVNWTAGSAANTVSAGVRGATIAGGGLTGDNDPDLGDLALLGLSGANRATGNYASVGGGFGNRADLVGTVGGGLGNIAEAAATVGGGSQNVAAHAATVGGGGGNDASGDTSTIAGGSGNEAAGVGASVGGGQQNTAAGASTTVSGGFLNTASGDHATVAGGDTNHAVGPGSAVPGGAYNCAGARHSFAAGRFAVVRPPAEPGGSSPCGGLGLYPGGNGDEGSFVWSDSSSGDKFVSSGPNQFNVRAAGGVNLAANTRLFFGSTTRQMINLIGDDYGIGVQAGTTYFRSGARFAFFEDGTHSNTALDPGTGGVLLMTINTNEGTPQGIVRAQTFTAVSDRRAKTAFDPVDPLDVLAGVLSLPLSRWSYRNAPGARHLGPVAQDFHAAFGLNGEDDTSIATVDADGVALAAIQGLNAKLEAENAALRAAFERLERRVEAMEGARGR